MLLVYFVFVIRCSYCADDSGDELILAASEDFSKNRHKFTGGKPKWEDFEIEGIAHFLSTIPKR